MATNNRVVHRRGSARTAFWLALGALAGSAGLSATAADAAEVRSSRATEHDAHAGHPAGGHGRRSVRSYPLPDLVLLDMHGERVPLATALRDDVPVLLNFIFTTCTSVCPVTSATFAETRRQLQAKGLRARLVSISIDPEHDTPERLRAYAARHDADTGWAFLTGRPADVVDIQRAFDTFRGNKMSHVPVTFVRVSPTGDRWVRLDGFTSAAALVEEVQRAAAR